MVAYLKATASKRSADKDKQRTKRLWPFFKGMVVNDVTAADVRSYIQQRQVDGIANATINRELALFSSAINYANREWEWNLPNPVKGRKLKEPEGRVRWITKEQAEDLIVAAEEEYRSPYLADLIRVALNTGCRAEELMGLEWQRVNLRANLIDLEAHHTKAGKRRSVPLNSTARQAMIARLRFRSQHCPASPWVFARKTGKRVQSVKKAFGTACEKAGLVDFRFHDLRHTCAAWLVSSGAPLAEVRDLLGHSSVTMTEKYAHLHPENVRETVGWLDALESRLSHVDGNEVLEEIDGVG